MGIFLKFEGYESVMLWGNVKKETAYMLYWDNPSWRNVLCRIYIWFSLTPLELLCVGRKRSLLQTMVSQHGHFKFRREKVFSQASWLVIFPYTSSPHCFMPTTCPIYSANCKQPVSRYSQPAWRRWTELILL